MLYTILVWHHFGHSLVYWRSLRHIKAISKLPVGYVFQLRTTKAIFVPGLKKIKAWRDLLNIRYIQFLAVIIFIQKQNPDSIENRNLAVHNFTNFRAPLRDISKNYVLITLCYSNSENRKSIFIPWRVQHMFNEKLSAKGNLRSKICLPGVCWQKIWFGRRICSDLTQRID